MEFTGPNKRKTKVGRPKKQRGAGRPKNKYRSYQKAKLFVHKLNLNSYNEWLQFARTDQCPNDIPTRPEKVYADFVSFNDWIGKVDFLPFEEAKLLVQQHKLMSANEFNDQYDNLFKRPYPLPRNPPQTYKSEWKGWKDFLGYEQANRNPISVLHEHKQQYHEQQRELHYRPFMDAVKYVSTLHLKDYNDWLEWRSSYKHKDIPWRPDLFYRTEWQGWKVFLGHDPLLALLDGTSILFIAKHASEPNNVYRIGINRLGLKDTIIKAQQEQLKLIRCYQQDNDVKQLVQEVIDKNCKHYDGNGSFVVHNIFDLMNDLFDIVPFAK